MRRAALATACVGLAVAGYLTAVRFAGGEPACVIAHGCSVVQQSSYAELGGVPVALLGLLGYAAILAALVVDSAPARAAAAGLSTGGFAFSAWLTYVEVARLDAICAWCVVSAVCMTLLAILTTARSTTPPGPGTGHRLGSR